MTDKVRKILEEVSANEDWKKELEERLKSVENAAKNAALLAAEILAVGDDDLAKKLVQMREDMHNQVVEKDKALQEKLEEL